MLGYSSFFSEWSKFHAHFRNAIENPHKVFPFWEKVIWSYCQKICILRREYLTSGVNVLTNNLKISDVTKADFFELNLSRIHGKIEKELYGANSDNVSKPLIRWLTNGVLKQDLLDA